MAVVDKAELKTGFWVGLGVVLALLVYSWAMALAGKLRERG